MAGIYIHIPFCKSKCPYCNFFSTASSRNIEIFHEDLIKEIRLRADYLEQQPVSTIYFGGGTPSLLERKQLPIILETLYQKFSISTDAEITLEANPDDICNERLDSWMTLGINRLSIGVQSFFREDLKYLGRVHDAHQSEISVQLALAKGFSNISLDLIFGMPGLTDIRLERNLRKAVSFGIPHISAYALTVEPKTALEISIRKNLSALPDEEKLASQFSLVMDILASEDYEHYEISNYCRAGLYSRHNSAYWNGEHYLGLGPSAHSYNGISRQWNISVLREYSSRLRSGELYFETETLSESQKFNEYIMTSLRTMRGANPQKIRSEFGEEKLRQFIAGVKPFLNDGSIEESRGSFCLTGKGKLFADGISSSLFVDIE